MSGALAGLKVLDFSTLLPGPFASLYLADMGAEVVHVEAPNRPDLVRMLPPFVQGQSAIHRYLNRNKQSICIDLKNAEQLTELKQRIHEFDIIIEQFRPGVMQRYGLDYQSLAAQHPQLIYCSITGYGQTGEDALRAGHDLNYLARSGIAGHSGRRDQAPPALGVQVADVAGGSLHAVMAILAAVIERQQSGLGQAIDISMTDCAATLNAMAAAASLAGQTQAPEQGVLNGGTLYDYYRTQDGRYLSIAALEPQFASRLAVLFDLPEIAQWMMLDAKQVTQLKQQLQARIASEPAAYWQQFFAPEDVCVELVLSLDEALHSPLAQARQWLVDVPEQATDTVTSDTATSSNGLQQSQHAASQSEKQLACPIKFSRSICQYRFVGQPLGAGQWPKAK